MQDVDLVQAFESCSHSELTHEEHVQLGYWYLRQSPLARVLGEFPDKLRRYAESKGADELYHETVTWAFLALINERMQSGPNDSWTAFSTANPDLLRSSILERYYSREGLDSGLARQVFVLPRPERSKQQRESSASRTTGR